MVLFSEITLNGGLLALFGLSVGAVGLWMIVTPGDRQFGVGFLASGLGIALLGVTNGFTDMSPLGRNLYRIGVISFVIGLPIVGYYFFRVLR